MKKTKGYWATGRLVIGIISCVLPVLILFQSCASGAVNTLTGNGATSGTQGALTAIFMLTAGIIGICTRKGRAGAGVAAVFYLFGALCTIGTGNVFGDLPVWGGLSLCFGAAFFIACVCPDKWWKWLLAVIAILVAVSCYFGAGGSTDAASAGQEGNNKAAQETGSTGSTQQPTVQTAESEAADTGVTDESIPDTKKPEEVTITEQILMEKDGIKVTATGYGESSLWGPEVKLLLENTTDNGVVVQIRNMSVNGIMTDCMFSCEVAAGKKANDEITFMKSSLSDAGISLIQNMEFNFYVYNAQDWTQSFESEPVYLATSADGMADQAVDNAGQLILEQDGISITVREVDSKDSFWGADVYLCIENNSDKNITVQARSVSLNGYMVTPMFSSNVAAGKTGLDSITFLSSELEDNGIADIEEMEISFHIFDTDSWTTFLESDAITVTF